VRVQCNQRDNFESKGKTTGFARDYDSVRVAEGDLVCWTLLLRGTALQQTKKPNLSGKLLAQPAIEFFDIAQLSVTQFACCAPVTPTRSPLVVTTASDKEICKKRYTSS
jgi:hypothetical protein